TRPAGPPEPRQQDAPVAAEARPAEERESVEGQAETKETCSSESRGHGRSGEGPNCESARPSHSRNSDDDRADSGGRRGRRARYRDRRRGRERGGAETSEPPVSENDVLVPVAGIVDVLDNYAFVRTSGYLAGPNDVYVSMSQVRKYGLRRG